MTTAWPNVTAVTQYQDSVAKAVCKNVLVLLLGMSIACINASAIRTFCKHQVAVGGVAGSLGAAGNPTPSTRGPFPICLPPLQIFYTNPRYILFIHLVVNDMVQVTVTVVLFVTSYTAYRIHASLCCALVLLALFTTQNTPLCLACMAVECCIAVRAPLRHAHICTVPRTLAAASLLLAVTTLSALSDLLIVLSTQPPGFFLSTMFCTRENILPGLLLVRKRDVTYWVFLLVVWITIFYSFCRILLAAKAVSHDAKKARTTLALHGVQVLLSMASYMIPQVKDTLQKWFPENQSDLRFVFYVVFQIIPRSLTPMLYGVRDKTFRRCLKASLGITVIRHEA